MALLHAKTAAGRQEIEDRARRLPAALRSILLMVDGQRDESELRGLFEGLRAPPDALQQLAALGLIEVVGGRAEPCLLYTSPSPRDQRGSRMPSSA